MPAAVLTAATESMPGGETLERPWGSARGLAAILATAGLPVAGGGGRRQRIVQAAPLALGMAGERELVDVYLTERMPIFAVRSAVERSLPPGWGLVWLHDVWTGAPALPACVAAADYRVEVAGAAAPELEAGVTALLGAGSLPRQRRRESRTTAYDLRALLLNASVAPGGGPSATLRMRLRHGPEAAGRPEDVVAALGEPPAALENRLEIRSIVRERLVLADDADAPAPATPARDADAAERPKVPGARPGRVTRAGT